MGGSFGIVDEDEKVASSCVMRIICSSLRYLGRGLWVGVVVVRV